MKKIIAQTLYKHADEIAAAIAHAEELQNKPVEVSTKLTAKINIYNKIMAYVNADIKSVERYAERLNNGEA